MHLVAPLTRPVCRSLAVAALAGLSTAQGEARGFMQLPWDFLRSLLIDVGGGNFYSSLFR
jgi:hypothetical protein